MDDLAWHLFNHITQLAQMYVQFQQYPCIEPDIIQTHPCGVFDMILAVDSVPWPGLDLRAPYFFHHPGIAQVQFFPEPVEHFFIRGTMDALYYCFHRAMLYNLIERLRRIFNRMVLRGDTLIPPCPPCNTYSNTPNLNGTIRLTPEHAQIVQQERQ
jgi:hypothetical protein